MSNRRRTYGRHAVQIAGVIQPLEATDPDSPEMPAKLSDISLGGVRLLLPRPVPIGSLWTLRFRTPDGVDREKTIIVRSCIACEGGCAAGTQYVARPATLRAAGVGEQSIESEMRDLIDEGRQPIWDAVPDISASEPLSVRTLCALTVCTDSDLIVADSIHDCTLDVYGRLIAPGATLAGGTAHVLRGVSLGALGTPDGTPTLVVLGESLKSMNMLAAAETELAARRVAVDAKRRAVESMSKGVSGSLSHAERERLMFMPAELEELQMHHAVMQENIRKLRDGEAAVKRLRLEVTRGIFPGVTIIAGARRMTFAQHLRGPAVMDLLPDGTFDIVPGSLSAEASIAGCLEPARRAA